MLENDDEFTPLPLGGAVGGLTAKTKINIPRAGTLDE